MIVLKVFFPQVAEEHLFYFFTPIKTQERYKAHQYVPFTHPIKIES